MEYQLDIMAYCSWTHFNTAICLKQQCRLIKTLEPHVYDCPKHGLHTCGWSPCSYGRCQDLHEMGEPCYTGARCPVYEWNDGEQIRVQCRITDQILDTIPEFQLSYNMMVYADVVPDWSQLPEEADDLTEGCWDDQKMGLCDKYLFQLLTKPRNEVVYTRIKGKLFFYLWGDNRLPCIPEDVDEESLYDIYKNMLKLWKTEVECVQFRKNNKHNITRAFCSAVWDRWTSDPEESKPAFYETKNYRKLNELKRKIRIIIQAVCPESQQELKLKEKIKKKEDLM